MSITATTKTSSTMIDNSWNRIFSSSSSLFSATCDTILKQQSKNDSINDSIWLWTAVGLGVYGLKFCSDALHLYFVSSAWNQRCNHRNRHGLSGGSAEDHLPTTQRSLQRRKRQIEQALSSTTYGDLQTKTNDNTANNNNNNNNKPQMEQANDEQCTTCVPPKVQQPLLEKTCAICLEDFQTNDTIGVSSNGGSCKHVFHKECLQHWLEKNTSCPTCRHRMLPDPDKMPWLLIPNR